MLTICIAVLGAGCSFQSESAYDIAVRNGFSGTETEWLASLKGDKGDKGDTGADGQNFNLGYTTEDLYNEAVSKGYTGEFIDFVKEIYGSNGSGTSSDMLSAVNTGLLSAVNIMCHYVPVNSTDTYTSGGAGVIYKLNKSTGDAYIITNYHVVYQSDAKASNKICETINVHLFGDLYFSNAIKAEYIGGSSTYDIAVLKISGSSVLKNSNSLEAVVADSNNVQVGETVIAVGNPESSGSSVTQGIVNVDSETIDLEDAKGDEVATRVIRIDASVNPGNSGGGLFNAKGEFIGIVNAKLVKENFDGIGYAIPSNIATKVAQNIIDNCDGKTGESVIKAKLGVEVQCTESKAVLDETTGLAKVVETIKVSTVYLNSPVLLSLYAGDVIESVEYGGKTYAVTRLHIVSDLLLDARVNDVFTFNVIRNGGKKAVSITMTSKFFATVA